MSTNNGFLDVLNVGAGHLTFRFDRGKGEEEKAKAKKVINDMLRRGYMIFVLVDAEFGAGGISVRWSAEGGSSSSRWRSAVEGIPEWGEVLKRWTFEVMDVFAFLEQCYDAADCGLYLDPPFPGPGDKYVHKFTPAMHKRLADRLLKFEQTRIVVRFHEHPLIRELYSDSRWQVVELEGRAQTNEVRDELLLVLNGAAK